MLKTLARLKKLHNLRDASAPINLHDSANAVVISFLNLQMMIHKADTIGDESTATSAYETTYTATTRNSKPLTDRKVCRQAKEQKTKRKKAKECKSKCTGKDDKEKK